MILFQNDTCTSVTDQVSLLWQIIEFGVMATDTDAACPFLKGRTHKNGVAGLLKYNEKRHLGTDQNAMLIW
jgi:hypothetical protein